MVLELLPFCLDAMLSFISTRACSVVLLVHVLSADLSSISLSPFSLPPVSIHATSTIATLPTILSLVLITNSLLRRLFVDSSARAISPTLYVTSPPILCISPLFRSPLRAPLTFTSLLPPPRCLARTSPPTKTPHTNTAISAFCDRNLTHSHCNSPTSIYREIEPTAQLELQLCGATLAGTYI